MNFTYLLRHYKLFRACALFRCLCKPIFLLPFPSHTWELGRHPKVIVNTQKFCLRDLRLIVNIIKKTNITNTYFLITLYYTYHYRQKVGIFFLLLHKFSIHKNQWIYEDFSIATPTPLFFFFSVMSQSYGLNFEEF